MVWKGGVVMLPLLQPSVYPSLVASRKTHPLGGVPNTDNTSMSRLAAIEDGLDALTISREANSSSELLDTLKVGEMLEPWQVI